MVTDFEACLRNRSRHAPVVIQRTSMDCGPAVLSSLLTGLGIESDYHHLREMCRTDATGVSVGMLVDCAAAYGVTLDQHVTAPEDVFDNAENAPSIILCSEDQSPLHYVVLWRNSGDRVEMMDPGTGREYHSRRSLIDRLYKYELEVPVSDWYEDASSSGPSHALIQRMRMLGLSEAQAKSLHGKALSTGQFLPLARLDAATRMLQKYRDSGNRLNDAVGLLTEVWRNESVPVDDQYWTARPLLRREGAAGEETTVVLGGVVLRPVALTERAKGMQKRHKRKKTAGPWRLRERVADVVMGEDGAERLQLVRNMFRKTEGNRWSLVIVLSLVAGAVPIIEALVYRLMMGGDASMMTSSQRWKAFVVILGMVVMTLGVRSSLAHLQVNLTIRIEMAARLLFHSVIDRLSPRYFSTRSAGDIADRAHSTTEIRELVPELSTLLSGIAGLAAVVAALIILAPSMWIAIVAAAATPVLISALFFSSLSTIHAREQRAQGGVSGAFVDTLRGIVSVKATNAASAFFMRFRTRLREQLDASLEVHRFQTRVDALAKMVGQVMAGGLVVWYAYETEVRENLLLFTYWSLQLPELGTKSVLDALGRALPRTRASIQRFVEPTENLIHESSIVLQNHSDGTPGLDDEAPAPQALPSLSDSANRPQSARAPRIEMQGITLVKTGVPILRNVILRIGAGKHVAIVGQSGAGKSTLVRVLLGLELADSGDIHIDGVSANALELVGKGLMWLDPDVQIWNRSMLENLKYGSSDLGERFSQNLSDAALVDVIARMPAGMATAVGEGGSLLSGGEGQQVRIARALNAAPEAVLALMDEPLRGLEHEKRAALMRKLRQRLRHATLVCVTHDISLTKDFDEVVVMRNGEVIEQGDPRTMIAENSAYGKMVREDERLHRTVWSKTSRWVSLSLERGELVREQEQA